MSTCGCKQTVAVAIPSVQQAAQSSCGCGCQCGDNCQCTPDNRCSPNCTCGKAS